VVSPTPVTQPPINGNGGTPSTAPTSAAALGFNYRVIVPTTDLATQARIRRLVPGAFRTTVNGQVGMQVGLFRERSDADQLQQKLNQQNLRATVIPVNSGGLSQGSQPNIVGL
jgi:hypothetical protein